MRKIIITEDFLRQRYVVERKTLQQIANELGVSRQTISNKLQEFNITIFNSTYIREHKKPKKRKFKVIPKYRIKEDFERVYAELKSLDLVADYYNINITTASDWKQRHQIPTIKVNARKRSERVVNAPYADKQWLENMYSKFSAEDIGRQLGCDPSTIRYWLKKFNIKSRSITEQWDLKSKNGFRVNPQGFDFEAYYSAIKSGSFTLHKRLQAYIKAIYGKCENPNCNESEVLDIHHIDENHNNNLPENHGVLCPNCHAKIHRLGLSFSDLVPNHISWEDILKNSYQEAK